jgi:ATP-binding cassette subfamily F protein uup
LTLSIGDKDKVGIIGPNGAGKSTLLKIMSGLVEPDKGEVVCKKFLRVAHVAQTNIYGPNETPRHVVARSIADVQLDDAARRAKVEYWLSKVEFADFDQPASELSGGWKKRLALAAELIKEPDFLMLDEPTNHLDLEGVLWLEEVLRTAPFAFAVISHDRNFLENITNRTIELNPQYEEGFLSVSGPYSVFLQARQEYMIAQHHEQQALASQVRREIAWLSRGARARQTKSQHRIREAGNLMEELAEVKARNATTSVQIDFEASGRKTKELVVAKGIAKGYDGRTLFANLDLILAPGHKLGLLGTNGSGKTTLLKLLAGQIEPDKGTIKRANDLKVVWFDQNREQLDQSITLRDALSPTGDSVTYRGRSIHIASWSKRFLFKPDQLNLPISYLSGGEQARILIARLMLQPADLLILDEPTNDLDIPSLEVLEESLTDFPGAVVLVTHDRYMLDTISTQLLALDGEGGTEFFSDYAQWESIQNSRTAKGKSATRPSTVNKTEKTNADREQPAKKSLSTAEKKELAIIGDKIADAELLVGKIKEKMHAPEVASNHVKLEECLAELQHAEAQVETLFARWQDLESRQ